MTEWEKVESAGIWQPEKEGDELIGEVVRVEDGPYGPQHTIKKSNGDEVRCPSHKVLQNRLVGFKQGDKAKIVYKGEEPPSVKGNNPTKMYEVFRGR